MCCLDPHLYVVAIIVEVVGGGVSPIFHRSRFKQKGWSCEQSVFRFLVSMIPDHTASDDAMLSAFGGPSVGDSTETGQ